MSRRFLTLHAVHPCESISPATILSSLIALCGDIAAYRSVSYPIHRRIIRESLRQTLVLQAFFQHIRDGGSPLPSTVVLSFSELHVILQKLQQLLHDCSKLGARLFLLINSDQVSYEFRSIARSISTALDVVPLLSIKAAGEVKDLVRLLTVQTWRVPVEIDATDGEAVAAVRTILSEIEYGVPPNPLLLRGILSRLGIQSWSECNQEIQFLEEEFFGGSAAGVGSLIGLMAYCRAALFDDVDGKKSQSKSQSQEEVKPQDLSFINIDDLRCPISLDLMIDPVTIATGHTYDRKSIERWFGSGYLTCPVTGEKLPKSHFVPNSALRSIITHFTNSTLGGESHNRHRDLSKTHLPTSSAIRMVAGLLVDRLKTGDDAARSKAAYEIRLLCKSSLFNRACFVEAGSVPWLLYLLYSSNPSIQENSVTALLNLSKHPDGRTAIHESGGVALIVDMVKDGIKLEAQQNAAAILFYLSSVPEYRLEIGESPDAIPSLIELLKRGTFRGKKNALVTLFGLLLFPGNYSKMLAAGVVPVIAAILSNERDELVGDAAAVLAKLAERRDGTAAILKSSALTQMVEVVRSSASRSGREYCVSALLSLCNNGGEKVVCQLEKMPLLMTSLYSLVTEGSAQAGKKARSLLNQIHQLHDQDYPVISESTAQDRIIQTR